MTGSPGPSSAGNAGTAPGTAPVAASGRGAAAGGLRDEVARVAVEAIRYNLPVDLMTDDRLNAYTMVWAQAAASAIFPIVERVRAEALAPILALHRPIPARYDDAPGTRFYVCAECCTDGDDGTLTDACAHDHPSPCWPCRTAIAAGWTGEAT